MRSELHGNQLDASLSREVWWREPPLFWRKGKLPSRFW